MFYKNLLLFLFILTTGCGFTPMNRLSDDKNISFLTEKISIGNIPNYEGFLLKTELQNALNPTQSNAKKEYTLNIQLRAPTYTDQSIQGDNFASRESVTISAKYQLKNIETGQILLSDSTKATGAYNIVIEPYATNIARNNLKKDLIKIVSQNITLRIVSYLKNQEDHFESEANTD